MSPPRRVQNVPNFIKRQLFLGLFFSQEALFLPVAMLDQDFCFASGFTCQLLGMLNISKALINHQSLRCDVVLCILDIRLHRLDVIRSALNLEG